jgi:LacI family transcriptional regulator
MATIREVAEMAGVSFATVSHVINQTRFVSEETRQRVLEAMKELGYRPNALAQSLRSGKTKTFGLILPDISNPFFAEIGRCIEDAAFKLGYSVILCNSERNPDKEDFYVDVLIKKQVDGVIFVGTTDQVESLDPLLDQKLPVVVIDRDLPNLEVDALLIDNYAGGIQATRHLIDCGHRRIACIGGPSLITPDSKRVNAYHEALNLAGLPLDERLVIRGDYHPESGYEITKMLLNQPDPPTAFFVCNDMMAFGALRAIANAGCKVPEDISVVGFDDIELAAYFNPTLTTVAQPKVEIGIRSTQLLIERIEQKSRPYQKAVLPVKLIVRESSGPLKLAEY